MSFLEIEPSRGDAIWLLSFNWYSLSYVQWWMQFQLSVSTWRQSLGWSSSMIILGTFSFVKNLKFLENHTSLQRCSLCHVYLADSSLLTQRWKKPIQRSFQMQMRIRWNTQIHHRCVCFIAKSKSVSFVFVLVDLYKSFLLVHVL